LTLPPDLTLRAASLGDEEAIAVLIAACDESYRGWAPPGWEPPPPGRELDRWRGRITNGTWWTRVALEPGGRAVGLVCFTQAVVQLAAPAPGGTLSLDPIPGRAHVSAVFTHPDRWRQGIASALLAHAEAAMRAEGYRDVQLWTPADAPARRFYVAVGWTHDGRTQWLAELSMPIVAYVKPL
jgi:GNAT superfamily N-acetyltransferase